MEYVKEYDHIRFRVSYFVPTNSDKRKEINFAAQPYEHMLTKDLKRNTKTYFIYVKVAANETIHIGLKGYLNEMPADLHERLGCSQ